MHAAREIADHVAHELPRAQRACAHDARTRENRLIDGDATPYIDAAEGRRDVDDRVVVVDRAERSP